MSFDMCSYHIQSDSDLGLIDGLAPDIEKSDIYARTGHPCRLEKIGLPKKRADMVLDMYMEIPHKTIELIDNSFLNEKTKRVYKRIIEERTYRYRRRSE